MHLQIFFANIIYGNLSNILKPDSSKPHVEETESNNLLPPQQKTQVLRCELQYIKNKHLDSYVTFILQKGRLETFFWMKNLPQTHSQFNSCKNHNI